MTNLPTDQRLTFDTELTLSGPFTGTAQLIGTIGNEPVILMIKNQSSVTVFVADNNGSTKGTTMVSGESIIMDNRANSGRAPNMGFPIGTSFYVTGTGGTGAVKISVLYAK
jgi:hypothetical protein